VVIPLMHHILLLAGNRVTDQGHAKFKEVMQQNNSLNVLLLTGSYGGKRWKTTARLTARPIHIF